MSDSLQQQCHQLAQHAHAASRVLASVSGKQRNEALHAMADAVAANKQTIQAENARDLEAGQAAGLSQALRDRLTLTDTRLADIEKSIRDIAEQPDPVGSIIEGKTLPNGIQLQKVRCPIGVVLMIFESRPNVTTDAAALCLKSGNAVILRGGKEAMHTNAALAKCVTTGLAQAGLPEQAVQLVQTTDRAAVGHLLKLETLIDVCIPRGGESLIRAVVEQAHIPVIKHYAGNCHVYIDEHCDHAMASSITLNAKTQRPGVCNATETLLVHKHHVSTGLLKQLLAQLHDAGVELRGDEVAQQACEHVKPASEEDWHTEYLDLILAVRIVDSLDQAIEHINTYGSNHTDAIVTERYAAANRFVREVDTANAFVNCSTRFSDGGQYGLGAEIGISTDKLHARGPMGAYDLTTYKWLAHGSGQVRN